MASRAKQGRGKRRGALADEIRWKSRIVSFQCGKYQGLQHLIAFSRPIRGACPLMRQMQSRRSPPRRILSAKRSMSKPADKKYLKLNEMVYYTDASPVDARADQVLMLDADWAWPMTLTTRDESSRAGAELDVHSDPSDICHWRSAGIIFLSCHGS
jgi:hypothetical protein